MSFVQNFDGAVDTLLTQLTPPFVVVNGADDFKLNGAGSIRRTVTGVANTFYATYNDGATSQTVSADMTIPQVGIMVFGSSSGGQLSGYFTRPQTGATSLRLWKIVAGVITQLAVSTTIADCIGIELSVTLVGGNPQLVVKRQGATLITFTDTAADRLTSGRRGIHSYLSGAVTSAAILDNYSDNSTNGPAVTLTFDERVDGYPFECVAGPVAISFTGGKAASTGTIERQVETEDGVVVSGWATTGMSSPTTTTWRWDNATLPPRTDGKDYRLRLREVANVGNTVLQANRWAVSIVIPYNDQSLDAIMSEDGKAPSLGAFNTTTDPVRANNCRVMAMGSKTIANSGVAVTRLNVANAYGSGVTQMADEIGRWVAAGALPNVPVTFVNIAVAGQTMDSWNGDAVLGNWSLLQFMAYMLAQAGGRISALMRSVVVWSGTPATGITAMNGIVQKVTDRLPSQPGGYTFPVWVRGGPRATRAASSVLNLRGVCDALGTQGGRYRRLTGPVIDLQMEAADQLHQATGLASTVNSGATAHVQGNRRLGFRQGRGVAAMLQELLGQPITIDRFGPTVVSRQFTSAAKTAFRVTYDRDTNIPDGSTTLLPQFYYSIDNKVTWVQALARKTGARTFEVDHPNGNWQGQTVHFAYCKDSPYGGGDDTGVTAQLAKLVYDASDFGAGTEMVAMADEGPVAEPGVTYTTIEPGSTVVLTKAQLATLRIKDNGARPAGVGSEPLSLRWERRTGDLTGRPFDGINIQITVA